MKFGISGETKSKPKAPQTVKREINLQSQVIGEKSIERTKIEMIENLKSATNGFDLPITPEDISHQDVLIYKGEKKKAKQKMLKEAKEKAEEGKCTFKPEIKRGKKGQGKIDLTIFMKDMQQRVEDQAIRNGLSDAVEKKRAKRETEQHPRFNAKIKPELPDHARSNSKTSREMQIGELRSSPERMQGATSGKRGNKKKKADKPNWNKYLETSTGRKNKNIYFELATRPS